MTIDIDIRAVTKAYGQNQVVHDIDLAVEKGQFVALLGPSGCGKTTTLRMIAGLEQPSSGDIFIRGRRINDVEVHRRNIGLVFQNHALFPHRTAFDNIAFGLKYRNVAKPEIARRVRRALEIVRLPHVEGRLPRQLSGGQQQRIAVARAIVIEPDVLLFDEPLSSLDANLREEMRGELKRIQKTLGITTIFVTHDQSEALSMADHVVLMHDGRIEQAGSPDELYNWPRTEFAARFFGDVNELGGTVVDCTDGVAKVKVGEGAVLTVASGMPLSGKVKLLLRAERARVVRAPVERSDASLLAGTITSSDYFGMLVRYAVDCRGQRLGVLQPLEGSVFAAGEAVQVQIPNSAWMLF
jgi:putative spermidine/putrescine transport system ATP-binding protein